MSLSLAGFDPSLLNFTANCTVVGLYFATAHVGQNDTIRTEFFRQALPAEYRDNFTFADIGNYILPEEAERRAKEVCRLQICDWAYRVIGFRGSPDITGIGVSLVLSTKRFICATLDNLNRCWFPTPPNASFSRHLPLRISSTVARESRRPAGKHGGPRGLLQMRCGSGVSLTPESSGSQ